MSPELYDALMVLFLFAVRIGIPVVITLALGYWLENKLKPHDEEDATSQQRVQLSVRATRSKVIQLHCWDMCRCPQARRAACAACRHPDLPCWLALQVDGEKVRQECFTCFLYKPERAAA